MDLGNKRTTDNDKKSLQNDFRRKCQNRVDVAEKMAPGCPNLGLERAKMTVIWGGPGAYDGHRRESTNRREDSKATT